MRSDMIEGNMPPFISRRALIRSLPASALVPGVAAAQVGALSPSSGIAPAGSTFVNPRKVLMWENTRREFRELLESGTLNAVIVPTGSTEQHNEHLAMIHDTASVILVAQQAALQLYPRALVATPVSVGISPHWMDRKGTLTLKKETFLAVVFEICESLKIHGVKNILVLNGHGGNAAPLKESEADFRQKLGINLRVNCYWDGYPPDVVKKYMESGHLPGHASEFETSFAMAAFPERVHWEGVDYEKAKPGLGIKTAAAAKQDEAFAKEAKLATTAKGEIMIAMAVNWVTERVRRLIAEG